MSRLGFLHAHCVLGLASRLVLRQCFDFFHFLLVMVQLICVSGVNLSVHLLVFGLSDSVLAVLSAFSFPFASMGHETESIYASVSLLARVWTFRMMNLASDCIKSCVVYYSLAIAA